VKSLLRGTNEPHLYRITPESVEQLNSRFYRMNFILPEQLSINPGQFVTIKSEKVPVLLPRPFCVHRWEPETRRLSLLIEARGTATDTFREPDIARHPFQILIPLGHGFKVKPAKYHFLVGGGCGVAPLHFLADELMRGGGDGAHRVFLAAGFRESADALAPETLAPQGAAITINVACNPFTAVDLFREQLDSVLSGRGQRECSAATISKGCGDAATAMVAADNAANEIQVYGCGPHPMLKRLAALCAEKGLPLQVSLERIMGCGMGACQGCSCGTKKGPVLLCSEGPVLDATVVNWDE
jgi:dihydroorotate dehydrogenase electron transfer subunit